MNVEQKRKPVSEETREKLRLAKLGKKRKPFTETHRAKLSEAQMQRRKKEEFDRLYGWETGSIIENIDW